jgi:tryptophan-rich sensory protein
MNFKKFIIILLLTFIIGTIPSWFISMDISNLVKPFDIPRIIFPIVWTILYFMMAVSYYLVSSKEKTLGIYLAQLIFNSLWTVLFFGLKLRLLAFIWLVILFILVIIMLIKYYKLNKTAGYLLIPYSLWLIFAGYLNLSIYFLNM